MLIAKQCVQLLYIKHVIKVTPIKAAHGKGLKTASNMRYEILILGLILALCKALEPISTGILVGAGSAAIYGAYR